MSGLREYRMKFAYEVTAAKQKGTSSTEDAPTQTPMAPRGGQRRNPSTDQKKVRRELAKKATREVAVVDIKPGDVIVFPGDDAPNPEKNTVVRVRHDSENLWVVGFPDGGSVSLHYPDSKLTVAGSRRTAGMDGFWEGIDAQLALAEKAKSADDVLRIFGKEPGISAGDGFFMGSGGDATLWGALSKAGWSWVKGNDIFWVMKAPNGDIITYIEGDIYRGDQMGTNASRKTAGQPSDVCPKCGEHMSDVKVYGDTLRAKCDSCGWSGSKKKSSRTAMEGLPMRSPQNVTTAPTSVQEQGMNTDMANSDTAEPDPMGSVVAGLESRYVPAAAPSTEYLDAVAAARRVILSGATEAAAGDLWGGNGWAVFVGESHGFREPIRRAINRVHGFPLSKVEFRECPDFEAESEIARASLRGRYSLVLTSLDLAELDLWS